MRGVQPVRNRRVESSSCGRARGRFFRLAADAPAQRVVSHAPVFRSVKLAKLRSGTVAPPIATPVEAVAVENAPRCGPLASRDREADRVSHPIGRYCFRTKGVIGTCALFTLRPPRSPRPPPPGAQCRLHLRLAARRSPCRPFALRSTDRERKLSLQFFRATQQREGLTPDRATGMIHIERMLHFQHLRLLLAREAELSPASTSPFLVRRANKFAPLPSLDRSLRAYHIFRGYAGRLHPRFHSAYRRVHLGTVRARRIGKRGQWLNRNAEAPAAGQPTQQEQPVQSEHAERRAAPHMKNGRRYTSGRVRQAARRSSSLEVAFTWFGHAHDGFSCR